jgi:hypothetical protein
MLDALQKEMNVDDPVTNGTEWSFCLRCATRACMAISCAVLGIYIG